MRRTEFAKLRRAIEAEEFRVDDSDPINYGLQRSKFETEKLKKLIAAAEKFDMQSTRRKAAQWKRRLIKAEEALHRFEALKGESEAKKPATIIDPAVTAALSNNSSASLARLR